ncbi:ELKS/Rab6-interacting/CAST family protein [Candidatus Nitrosopelagicus sp.]|jgi:methyl-accepting chemotaxis protein|nr:ELKS/Rab6-interacting/CAST family protein [Candidatus Nitrosopelagicus sp.]
MVFGWSKKKKVEYDEPVENVTSISQTITLDEIPKILNDIVILRKGTLAAEIKAQRNRIDPQRVVLLKIANELSEDELDPDKLDPHFQIMVNRGKKEVISSIKKEFANPFPDINSPDDIMRFKKATTAGIKKVGDMLGKHSRVIHIFAKKYAKKLKEDLENLTENLKDVDELIDNFNNTENSVQTINELLSSRNKTLEKLSKQNSRMNELKSSITDNKEKITKFENEIKEIKSSSDYKTYLDVKSQLSDCDSEEVKIRHHVNDEFTKISRPLGKFVHISSHDKELKDLTAKLASTPYDVLNTDNISGIKKILDYIVTGIDTGSVSVKDISKSKHSVAEIKNLIPSLISIKEKFETKKHELIIKLENFDSKSLQTAENNLKREESNISDTSSKLKIFEDENLDLTHSLPTILHQIERNLKDVTSTSYTISLDNK